MPLSSIMLKLIKKPFPLLICAHIFYGAWNVLFCVSNCSFQTLSIVILISLRLMFYIIYLHEASTASTRSIYDPPLHSPPRCAPPQCTRHHHPPPLRHPLHPLPVPSLPVPPQRQFPLPVRNHFPDRRQLE
uniref:(northern house mosquito) hypothetical protein n=1 Tax=Culex pipiens TaxID=7175 RepID=A0A8D8DTU8_CULPI